MGVVPQNERFGRSEEMHAAATRVLESATFVRSQRLREFLSFVVKCSLENRAQEVNEYSLGVQVFGKSPNYNPSQDNIVRVTARQLRAKLNEYYAREGSLDSWRVEIPKGAYLPVLQPNLPTEPVLEAAPVRKRRLRTTLLAFLGLVTAAGLGAAASMWWHAPRVRPQPAYLLTPLLADRARPTTIVLDDPLLPRAWQMVGNVMTLDDFVAGRYLDQRYYKESDDYMRLILRDDYLIPFSSVRAFLQMSDIARSHSVETVGTHCRALQPEGIKSGNLIFIGGIGSDPWVVEIQKHLAFEHRVDPKQSLRTFVNRSPRPGEPRVFEPFLGANDTRHYTRVAVLKNPFGPGKIALLGGTSRVATEAAGQFALSQAGVDQVQQLCGAPLEKVNGFELILKTKPLAGTPVTGTIVASRCDRK